MNPRYNAASVAYSRYTTAPNITNYKGYYHLPTKLSIGTFAPLSVNSEYYQRVDKENQQCYDFYLSCRSGGIGRRAGFKIPSSQEGEGSTPSSGTIVLSQKFILQTEIHLENLKKRWTQLPPPAF